MIKQLLLLFSIVISTSTFCEGVHRRPLGSVNDMSIAASKPSSVNASRDEIPHLQAVTDQAALAGYIIGFQEAINAVIDFEKSGQHITPQAQENRTLSYTTVMAVLNNKLNENPIFGDSSASDAMMSALISSGYIKISKEPKWYQVWPKE